jgi:DNA replication and repair protein RecF
VFLRRLALSNFRNYSELNLEPSQGLNVFVGPNAQGKSNLLEGIALLGTGKSFRTTRDADTVRIGCERGVVQGNAHTRAGSVELACSIDRAHRGTRKTYTVNAHPVRYASYLGRVRIVTFVPTDLQLASGMPSGRRAFLNGALAQTEPPYYFELARYRKALQQRNAMLRGAVASDAELLEIYDSTLIEAGTQIMLARDALVRPLAYAATCAHARLAVRERLDVRYNADVAFENPNGEAIRAAFASRLRASAEAERTRKATLVGPHRDDLSLTLDGEALAVYGSQGQHRTAVLALKVAEYSVMRERSGEAPLLLLDDVLSELDEERADAFLRETGEYEQAFVTATALPQGLPQTASVARVHYAKLQHWIPC